MKQLAITAEVPGEPRDVFQILGDISKHGALACRAIELVDVSQDGNGRMLGVIDLRGPFGIHRRIAMREVVRQSPTFIWGVAASNTGSLADVRWELERASDLRTRVSLSVQPVKVGLVDRSLLVVGGRLMLSGVLRNTLKRLEALLPAVGLQGATLPLDGANPV